jgi:peptidoglycan/LPS O-acetylase OafA/YrhL
MCAYKYIVLTVPECAFAQSMLSFLKGRAMRITPMFLALVFAGASLTSRPALAQTQATPGTQSEHRRANAVLQQAAQFEHQVTGVTISERGRIFVNFPRWTTATSRP